MHTFSYSLIVVDDKYCLPNCYHFPSLSIVLVPCDHATFSLQRYFGPQNRRCEKVNYSANHMGPCLHTSCYVVLNLNIKIIASSILKACAYKKVLA